MTNAIMPLCIPSTTTGSNAQFLDNCLLMFSILSHWHTSSLFNIGHPGALARHNHHDNFPASKASSLVIIE